MSNEPKPLLSDERFDEVILHDTVSDRYMLRFYAKRVRDLYEPDRSKLMAVLQVCADAIENSRVELCSAIPHLPTVGVNLATAREKECRDAISQLKAIGIEPNK